MRDSNRKSGAGDRERAQHRDKRNFARRWSAVSFVLAVAAGCAAQEDPGDDPGGVSGATSGGSTSAGSGGSAGKAGGNATAGSGGTQAGASTGGTPSTGGGGNGGSSGNAGSGGSSGGSGNGGSAGMTGGAGAGGSAGTAGQGGSSSGAGGSAGMGGKGGAGGAGGAAGGNAGAGGKGGAGGNAGMGGTMSVDPCENKKKDGTETDVDCGGECTDRCATGKGCGDLTDCIANNVCDAKKCRADGCNATNCAYSLTRYIIGSGPAQGQVFVSWDTDSLDVKFEILDSTSFDDSANSWEDDSVEIYLDLNHAKTATYEADDFQINVSRHAGNNVVGIGTNLNTGAVTVTRTTDANGYTLIVSVPWSALNGATYPQGKTIGFDVGVNDDSDGGTRNAQMMLYGTDTNYLNTSQFGNLAIP
jgi:hypothetical protein